MDGRRFDLLSKSLAPRDSRRSTLRGLAAGILAAGLSRLGPPVAKAKKKKKKKCRKLKQPCNGSSLDNNCCGSLLCFTTTCQAGKRCCKGLGSGCTSVCDCCGSDRECISGECCVAEGGACAIFGESHCCPGLSCDVLGSITCQPD